MDENQDTSNPRVSKHQYQRLMRRSISNTYTDHEREGLFNLLNSGHGVSNVNIIEKHPKGGYSVTFSLSPESFEAFILLLDAHDWMSVI